MATFPLLRLYIVCGVPESTVFETRTKKEISAITWHKIKDLPASREVQVWRAAPRLARDHGLHCGRDRPEISRPTSRPCAQGTMKQFWMVGPFIKKLNEWISAREKAEKSGRKGSKAGSAGEKSKKAPNSAPLVAGARGAKGGAGINPETVTILQEPGKKKGKRAQGGAGGDASGDGSGGQAGKFQNFRFDRAAVLAEL